MKIKTSNTAPKKTESSSTEPAAPPAKKHLGEVDALAATGQERILSANSALALAPSHPSPTAPQPAQTVAKQGPFARLPLEMKGEILSWLKFENKQVQQAPRAVSREFYQASAMGLLEVNDGIASGYLRKILCKENFAQTDELETFFVEQAPKMRTIDLVDSYQQNNFAKADLLHQLLSRPDATFQSINLKGCTAIIELPQELKRVSGDFNLSRTGITQLPQGLTVGGSLNLRGTRITQLPQGLTVGGDLDLNGTRITQLPQGLTVGGDLELNNTNITQLPQGLTVGGHFCFYDSRISQLPQGLTVGGMLYLKNFTGITQLPQGLTVGGSLNLEGTRITQLPQGLTVGGSLYLEGTRITQLPQGLTVGGSLNLEGTRITQLPQGLTVGGNLTLRNFTGITQLPQGLTIGGHLILNNSGITQLPQGLTVGGSLHLTNTGILELPEDLRVTGDIFG